MGRCGRPGAAAIVLLLVAPPHAHARQPSWPAPEAARIRFARSLDPGAVRGKASIFARIARVLVGGEDPPRMQHPHGVAVGPDGRLYVADSAAGVVHVYGLAKVDYRTLNVGGESLIGIAFAGDRMVITDSIAGRVRGFDLKGRQLWSLGRDDGFERPTGVAAAGDRVFVVDTVRGRIVR